MIAKFFDRPRFQYHFTIFVISLSYSLRKSRPVTYFSLKMKSLGVVGILATVLMASSVSGNYDYAEVIEKSLLFYEAQRTGYLPPTNR